MSIQTINIVLFGKGNVGTTLINQILESQTFFENSRNINIQFAVIANSQKGLFLRNDLTENWQDLIENAALYQQMAEAHNPYGDGTACKQIIEFLKNN